MAAFDQLLRWLDLAGIAVFAVSGALVASRKQMDAVGFVVVAAVTGLGGGTLRDLLLGRAPVQWLRTPEPLLDLRTLRVRTFRATAVGGALYRALITAIPQIPLPASVDTFSCVIPPMAITGMDTASQIAFNVSCGTSVASSLEPVGNTAPTPR